MGFAVEEHFVPKGNDLIGLSHESERCQGKEKWRKLGVRKADMKICTIHWRRKKHKGARKKDKERRIFFRAVTPCSLVSGHWRFGKTCCSCLLMIFKLFNMRGTVMTHSEFSEEPTWIQNALSGCKNEIKYFTTSTYTKGHTVFSVLMETKPYCLWLTL